MINNKNRGNLNNKVPGNLNNKTQSNASVKEPEALQTPLAKLHLLLIFLGFDAFLMPVSIENPVEQLIVSSGTGEEESGFMLQLMFINDMLPTDKVKELETDPVEGTFYLQFYGMYTVKVKEEKYWDMYRLMSIVGNILPLGNFGQNDEGIFFRDIYPCVGKELNNKLMVELIKMIFFCLDNYGMALVEFARNDKTVEETVREIEIKVGNAGRTNI